MAEERLDVIIFGASGFTGKHTVFEAVKVLENLKWGIAGRSKEKLENVLKEMGDKAKVDLTKTPIIIADVKDEKSIKEMAQKCKIIVNCCGPYTFFGEIVVKSCIEAGTHHVDVSGEPYYMELMQLKYNDLAKENGVYVVSACGFDSIPVDLGTVFTENHFDGVVNSIESYLESWESGGHSSGAAINYGTWRTIVHGLTKLPEIREIRSKLYPVKLPSFLPKLKSRSVIHKTSLVEGYCLPFPGSDKSVVHRTQRFFFDTENKRPIQMIPYFAMRSLLATIFLIIGGIMVTVMTKFSLGRKMLLSYPSLFTFGFVSRDGPSEEKMSKARFAVTFKAQGWPLEDKLAEVTDKYTNPPSKTLITKVSGNNPGYGATCVALLASAVMTLKENNKMPGNGGVLTPGAAFGKTSIINEMRKYENGMKFEIISGKEKETTE